MMETLLHFHDLCTMYKCTIKSWGLNSHIEVIISLTEGSATGHKTGMIVFSPQVKSGRAEWPALVHTQLSQTGRLDQ